MSGRLGIVLYDPSSALWHYSSQPVPGWMVSLFVRLQSQQTYICQFELLAALCAYITFPDVLGNMLAHHFLDNLPAMQSLIKGGSSGRISARTVHEYSLAVLSIACRPWKSFVYSEDNISDLPSRNEFRLLRRLRAVRRPMRLPSLSHWLDAESSLF